MKRLLFILLLIPFWGQGQIIVTIAGTGEIGYSGDDGVAVTAKLNAPIGLKADNLGNIFFADSHNSVIRKINTSGVITTIAGTGILGYSGDSGPATNAELWEPTDLAFDVSGNMYVADGGNNTIRKISTSGIITTVAGTGTRGYSGDGGYAIAAEVADPFGLVFDKKGDLIFSDGANHRIRKITTSGIINTIGGIGTGGYSGDGGPATAAEFKIPSYLAINRSGEILVPDWANHRVRKIDTFGIVTTIIGTGAAANTGDGTLAVTASIHSPEAILIDDSDNLIISSFLSYVIRKVNTAGIISTIAGTGTAGYSGDGGPATLAQFNQEALCTYIDNAGNLYITDRNNHRIRRINYNTAAIKNVANKIEFVCIWPNPVHNEFTVSSTGSINQITITNCLGQTVYANEYNTENVQVGVADLPSGIYFIKINGSEMRKFVKQ